MSLIVAVADYTASFPIKSGSALDTARECLIDALARGFEALREAECASLMSPLVPGAVMPGGARIPGTSLELDPAQAAFCLGVMLCRSAGGEPWLDLPPAGAAAALAAVLATADYVARRATMEGKSPPTVRDVLAATVKALEIQGVLALENGSQQAWTASIRIAHLAAAAVATAQLGGGQGQIVSALGYSFLDGATWVDADEPCNTGRRDWVMADAISRAVRHACQAMAAGRSRHPTAVDLEIVDITDGLLRPGPSARDRPFGTAVVDRLAGRRTAQDLARLATRFQSAVDRYFPARQAERVKALFAAPERLDELPVNELLATLVTNGAR